MHNSDIKRRNIADLLGVCCAQASIIWGQAVRLMADACVANGHLDTYPAHSLASAVSKVVHNCLALYTITHNLTNHFFGQLTEVKTDLYPLYTPLITTTTMYIN